MQVKGLGKRAVARRTGGGARRVLLALGASSVLAFAAFGVAAAPAGAYGPANYEVTFAGTAVKPTTGPSFGFWGWCDLAGGNAVSGSAGDCQVTQYVHSSAGSGFTCHESLDLSGWDTSSGTIVISGTASVVPAVQTGACISFFPGSSPFNINTGFPSAPGHYNIGVGALAPGAVGTFNVTVKLLP